MSRKLKIVAVAAAFGLALYAAIYFTARDEESVKFVTAVARQSKSIQDYVGGITSIRLSPGGPYDETEAEGEKHARIALEVEGRHRSTTIIFQAMQSNGTWRVVDATIDGRQVSWQ